MCGQADHSCHVRHFLEADLDSRWKIGLFLLGLHFPRGVVKCSVSSVQSLSRVPLFATLWTAARQASLSFTISQSLLKLMPIESVMPSNHLILCRPLLLLPSVFPSIRVCSNESVLRIRWPKYWSFSFSVSPSNEHPGLISSRMDWLDLLQSKSLLQHYSSKASILWHSTFFMVHLSHLYMVMLGDTRIVWPNKFIYKKFSNCSIPQVQDFSEPLLCQQVWFSKIRLR